MPSVCLCMIVRNEAPVIRRCLESVRPLIGHWVIVDTGSTDGTQDIVRDFMVSAEIPGELHERPWVDFAHNRSEALRLARDKAGYTLIIDADDFLEYDADFTWPDLVDDSYSIRINDTALTYQRTQLVSNALEWRYDGVLHEFLSCEDARTSGSLAGITMRRNHDGARRRDPATYRRDAEVLEKALKTEPRYSMRVRYVMYLAQSYRDCGETEKALENYLKRAELGEWDQEVYVGLCEAAGLQQNLEYAPEAVLATYDRAIRTCPWRAEAYHGASRYLRLRDRFAEGYAMARRALDLPLPDGALFVSGWIYEYGLLDEYAVNAYWSGHYDDCVNASRRILALDTLPAGERPRIQANADVAAMKMREAEPPPPDYAVSTWAPEHPRGGTELMVEGLRSRLGDALDRVDLKVNWFDPAWLTGKPLIVWMHHDIDQQAVQWCGDGDLVSRVDRFVFVSYWQMDRFIRTFRLPPGRCVVLKNAATMDRPPRASGSAPVRRLAYISAPFRGLDVLLDAWDRLRPENAELHIWSSLKLYGEASDDSPYEALFARAAELPNVYYRGIVPNEQLRKELRGIDYLVYPSTFAETSCLSVIEAMAAGCRVICPALGALPETTAGFARLYPWQPDHAAHVTVFADELADELGHPWAGRRHLATEEQMYCRSTYDWTVRAEEWKSLIGRLTGDDLQERKPIRTRPVMAARDDNQTFARFLAETEANSLDERLATHHWRARCEQLREDARVGDRFDFLRWPSLTDFSVPESYVPAWCYDELRASPVWDQRWFPLTRESKVGQPRDFSRDYGTSPILIQHAAHLLKYEAAVGQSLLDCDAIFEIGGGYGSFCRLLANSGFTGLHVVYDLPHMSSVQRLFLTLSGFTEVPREDIARRGEHGFCLVADDDGLDAVFAKLKAGGLRVGFVATWSLSEIPMAVRARIFPRFHDICSRYLIAFQPAWESISNIDYFADVQAGRPDLAWKRFDISPGFYLFS